MNVPAMVFFQGGIDRMMIEAKDSNRRPNGEAARARAEKLGHRYQEAKRLF